MTCVLKKANQWNTLIYLEKAALLVCVSVGQYIKCILVCRMYLTDYTSWKLVLHGYDVHV